MNWSSLPQSPAVDAALRRAALDVVGVTDVCTSPTCQCSRKKFLPDRSHDNLARVLEATEKLLTADDGQGPPFIPTMHQVRLIDLKLLGWPQPRAALCGLLDLLNITPPEGLEA